MFFLNARTRALSISPSVRETVYIRDGGVCVLCKRPGIPNAHVVRRSQGGLGIAENIVTLCPRCHRKFDEGKSTERESAYVNIVAHLKGFYPDWNKEDMRYKKEVL